MDCVIYRCARQAEMYLYVRQDFPLDELPEVLRKRVGELTQVMELSLGPERKLARVDVSKVKEALQAQGFFLQMPPDGRITAHLHIGD